MPKKNKESVREFEWSISTSRGRRDSNEDTHCIKCQLGPPLQGCSFMGIFDGHGGLDVSTAASKGILNFILNSPILKKLNLNDVFIKNDKKTLIHFEVTMVKVFK